MPIRITQDRQGNDTIEVPYGNYNDEKYTLNIDPDWTFDEAANAFFAFGNQLIDVILSNNDVRGRVVRNQSGDRSRRK